VISLLAAGRSALRKRRCEFVWCVDFGSSKVGLAVYRIEDGGTPVLEDLALGRLRGVKAGVVVDYGKSSADLKAFFQKAREKHPGPVKKTIIGLSGSYLSSQIQRAKVLIPHNRGVDESDVVRAVQQALAAILAEGQVVVHALPQRFILDKLSATTHPPLQLLGEVLEVDVLLVAGFSRPAQNVVNVIKEARVVAGDLALNVLAAGAAVLSPEQRQIGVALVDIGAETTDIALYYGGETLYTKSLPFGGRHITSDLSSLLSTYDGEAEEMKIRYGCADPELVEKDLQVPYHASTTSGYRIAEVIWHRFDEIARAVAAEIRHNGGRFPLAAGICLTGGTSRLRAAAEVLAAVTGRRVWLGHPDATLNEQQIRDPACAAALGLISFHNVRRPPRGVVKQVNSRVSRFYKYLYGDNEGIEMN